MNMKTMKKNFVSLFAVIFLILVLVLSITNIGFTNDTANNCDIKLDLSYENEGQISYLDLLTECYTEKEVTPINFIEKLGYYIIESLSFKNNKTKEAVELIIIKGDWQAALKDLAGTNSEEVNAQDI